MFLKEELEQIFDKVYPRQVNLKSFDKKQTLNPSIWKDGDLKKIIRSRLVNIARDFMESIEIDGLKIHDIVIVGSIAGYNWSKYSDIDLHIIVDFDSLANYGTSDIIKQLFDMKRSKWNDKHNILIYGYPVELYVQDTKEVNASDGIYSVLYGKWMKLPTGNRGNIDRELVKALAAQYINIIDMLEEYTMKCKSRRTAKILYKEVDKIHDEIVMGRREGIAQEGEDAARNIVFKVLRRTGHIGKTNDLKTILSDKINSIS